MEQEIRKYQVSIVVPVHNGERYISETLKSLLKQKSTSFELILVDDASTDGTNEILSDLSISDMRLSVYRNPENLGVCKSRNIGIDAAVGQYIVFVDADDVLSEFAIYKLVKAIEETSAVLGYLNVVKMDQDGFLIRDFYNGYDTAESSYTLKEEPLLELIHRNIVECGSGVIVRNDKVLYFDEEMKSKSNEIYGDWEFYLNAATKGSFVLIKDAYVAYRIHGNSMSRATAEPLESLKYIIKKYDHIYAERNLDFRNGCAEVIGFRLAVLLKQGRFKYLFSSLKYFGIASIFEMIKVMLGSIPFKCLRAINYVKNIAITEERRTHYKNIFD